MENSDTTAVIVARICFAIMAKMVEEKRNARNAVGREYVNTRNTGATAGSVEVISYVFIKKKRSTVVFVPPLEEIGFVKYARLRYFHQFDAVKVLRSARNATMLYHNERNTGCVTTY